MAGLVAMLGFSSCQEDKDPVYHNPTEFKLNTPAMADQYLELTPDGTFSLTAAAQPNYGYSAVTTYSALVCLDDKFAEGTYAPIAAINKGQSQMEFSSAALAQIICELKGMTTEDTYVNDGPIPVYFKGVAELPGVEGSRIESSNVVCYKQVGYYYAVPTAGYIYIVGNVNGWNEPKAANKDLYADWRLFEADNAIGSKVYSNVFNFKEGELIFRFYTALTGWDADSYGIQEEDNPIEIEMVDGSYAGSIIKGKGSYKIANWEGGEMTIVVDMSNEEDMTVTFSAGAQEVFTPRYVYMVGNNGGWDEPSEANAATYEPWRLVDKKESGVYTGTFDFTDFTTANGVLYCRFYEALTGWGKAQWAAAVTDGDNVDIDFGAAMPTYEGEGCFTGEVGGTVVTITLDTNNNTVLFEQE